MDFKTKISQALDNGEKIANDDWKKLSKYDLCDKKFVLKLLRGQIVRYRGCGDAHAFADTICDELSDDCEVVIAAVKKLGRHILKLASKRIQDDRSTVLEVVKIEGRGLEFASERLRDDYDIVLQAVSNNGRSLEFASERLRDNYDIVLQAVSWKEFSEFEVTILPLEDEALNFASERLRADKSIALKAVKKHGNTILLVSDQLRNDRDVIKESLLSEFPLSLPEKFQSDRELVAMIVSKKGDELRHSSENLQKDRELVILAVKSQSPFCYSVLSFLDKNFLDDKEIVLQAIKRYHGDFQYISERLRADTEIVKIALNEEIWQRFYNEEHDQIDWFESAIYPHISPVLQKNTDIILMSSSFYDLRKSIDEWKKMPYFEKLFYQTTIKSQRGPDAQAELDRRNNLRYKVEQKEIEEKKMESKFEEYKTLRNQIVAMPEYQKWRSLILERDGHKCVVCNSAENLEVDHRFKSFYSIVKQYGVKNVIDAYECLALWDTSNGSTLCKSCHDKTTSSQKYFASK